eukprot:3589155-Amphidinium_carterae.1
MVQKQAASAAYTETFGRTEQRGTIVAKASPLRLASTHQCLDLVSKQRLASSMPSVTLGSCCIAKACEIGISCALVVSHQYDEYL